MNDPQTAPLTSATGIESHAEPGNAGALTASAAHASAHGAAAPSASVMSGGSGNAPLPNAAALAAEAQARARRVSDGAKAPIVPDCCNLGIALRILVPLNLAAVVFSVVVGQGWLEAAARFIDIAMVMEPTALGSLVLLCVLRKRVNGMKQAWQWLACVGIPSVLALLASAMLYPILTGPSYVGSAPFWVFGRVLLAAVCGFAITEFLHLRARAFSPSLSEARLQALQARIRPHFLFNSLNTVLGLMRSDPRTAERTLENLADLFRVFMKDTRALLPLDEEVVTCQQYLAIEQLRLGDRLQIRWELDQMPGDALLPSLLLQPLIENSVHHGIEPRTEPGEVFIRITQPGERVRVEIINPAQEKADVRPGNQMALSNVRERLMLLYDMEAELRTGEEAGEFRLLLEIPYRKERRRRDVRRHLNTDR